MRKLKDPEHVVKVMPMELMIQVSQRAIVGARGLASVKSGELRDKIGFGYIDIDGMRIEIGAYADHSGFVEFGTVRMRARPFFRPPVWAAVYQFWHDLPLSQLEWWRQ